VGTGNLNIKKYIWLRSNGKIIYRMIQVLPPERKHPLLIDLKFSKNSGINFCT
jgi:hypothetical protein